MNRTNTRISIQGQALTSAMLDVVPLRGSQIQNRYLIPGSGSLIRFSKPDPLSDSLDPDLLSSTCRFTIRCSRSIPPILE
ncbi:hypothetical protein Trydic_g22272 [Trypoxylus dichotomus]